MVIEALDRDAGPGRQRSLLSCAWVSPRGLLVVLLGVATSILTGYAVLAVIYSGLLVLVLAHELGHLVAARLSGIDVSSLVVGVGPCLAACEMGGTKVEVRLLPVVGWVLLDDVELRARPGRAMIVSLAGPFTNLLLGVGLVVASIASVQGPSALGAGPLLHASRLSGESAVAVWWDPYLPLADGVGSIGSGPAVDEAEAAAVMARTGADDATVRSVVALAGESRNGGGHHSVANALVLVAAMSLTMAGFNLVPARGLDGYHALEGLAAVAYRRSRRWGRRARRALSLVGTISAALAAWWFITTVVSDVIAMS